MINITSEITFRRAMPGEMHLLAGLAVASWRSAINTDDQSCGFEKNLYSHFLDFCLNNYSSIIVAEQGGCRLGWGAYLPDSNYISDLWVAPAHQGKSIGSKLLQNMVNIIVLSGYERIKIGTYANNESAIAFYKKMGFVEYLTELEYSPLLHYEILKTSLILKV